MAIINSLASWWMRKRMHQIELFMKYPYDVQDECLKGLLSSAEKTEWGKKYNYKQIKNAEQFAQNVPIQDYETLKPYIERIRNGEQNLLWNTDIDWFAKSSGTTNDKSKFIPVSKESLKKCHFNGGRDMIAIYCDLYADSQLFTGKYLGLAGSIAQDELGNYQSRNGDLSAIMVNNLPKWTNLFSTPDPSTLLLDEWDKKLEKIARTTSKENVVSLAGVPSWMLIVMQQILELTGKKSIVDVWPNLEVYFHGGVNFTPYKAQFDRIIGKSDMNYLELYNASEGFFGIQDQRDSSDLLLMLDYGIYYEFMPVNALGVYDSTTLTLDKVETGKNYALVISTNGGLWRYMLGDTIKFTSLAPFRFVITGRTKQFMNAFGEEVSIENADQALAHACARTNAQIKEYTAAPVYINGNESGAHEWLIEFETPPASIAYFSEMLDNHLKALNSDYEAKRYHSFILTEPVVKSMPRGTFYNWLQSKNKLGGQQKVPRLSNNRKVIDEINAL
jgi:GH3 auxin-responsive promoter